MAEKLGERALQPVATPQRLQLAIPDFQTKATRLASSLDEFAANVAGITIRKSQEAATKQEKEGREAAAEAIAAGHATLGEMVKAGIIDQGSNPFFRDGVLFMAGKARADAYNNALTVAAAQEIPADSTDPKAMDALIERVAGEFVTSEDDDALRAGFAERAESYAVQQQQRHARTVANNLEDLNLNQAADLFRGVSLQATDGVDPEFMVENLVPAIRAQAEEYLGNIDDAKPFQRRTMNRAIAAALASLVDDGVLGEDAVKEVALQIKTGTGTLWGSLEHSATIQAAIDTQVNRETRRLAFEQARELRQKQSNEKDAVDAMFIAAGESGILDTSEIERRQRASGGTEFRLGFMKQMENLSLTFEQAAQETYVGNEALRREYGARILSGENISLPELGTRVKIGELTLDQAVQLGNMSIQHRQMLANDPRKAAMFRRTDAIVKGGLTSWAGSDFGSQSYAAALESMALALGEFQDTHQNATAESPEFLKFTNDLMKDLQRQYMGPGQWQELQEVQAENEGENVKERYNSQVFESSKPKLMRWYAEALMMSEGFEPSSDLADFFTTPGRGLGADEDIGAYADAIFGQLVQSGVDMRDPGVIAKIDRMKNDVRGVTAEPIGIPGIDFDQPDPFKPEVISAFRPQVPGAPIPSSGEVLDVLLTRAVERLGTIPESPDPKATGEIPSGVQVVRDALIKLGWIPPAGQKNQPSLPPESKLVRAKDRDDPGEED